MPEFEVILKVSSPDLNSKESVELLMDLHLKNNVDVLEILHISVLESPLIKRSLNDNNG